MKFIFICIVWFSYQLILIGKIHWSLKYGANNDFSFYKKIKEIWSLIGFLMLMIIILLN